MIHDVLLGQGQVVVGKELASEHLLGVLPAQQCSMQRAAAAAAAVYMAWCQHIQHAVAWGQFTDPGTHLHPQVQPWCSCTNFVMSYTFPDTTIQPSSLLLCSATSSRVCNTKGNHLHEPYSHGSTQSSVASIAPTSDLPRAFILNVAEGTAAIPCAEPGTRVFDCPSVESHRLEV